MKMDQLRDELESRDLDYNGDKATLLKRLEDAMKNSGGGGRGGRGRGGRGDVIVQRGKRPREGSDDDDNLEVGGDNQEHNSSSNEQAPQRQRSQRTSRPRLENDFSYDGGEEI